MHRATSVGSTKSAYRSRVYESDPWEVEDARVGKLGQPDVATGSAIPPYIMGRAWQVGASRGCFAPQKRRGPDDPTRQAPKNWDPGDGTGFISGGKKNQEFCFDHAT